MLKDNLFLPDWPGFDFVFFDCDSTLSYIEGIDELARQKGKFDEVKKLTDAAMEGEIHLQNVYDRRLDLLCPTRADIRELEHLYRKTLVPDTKEVINILQSAGKEIFIVSGGLLAAVRPFGEWLGIPRDNIRAVDVYYNKLSGQWWDYQQDMWGQPPDEEYLDPEASPLIESNGKSNVVLELIGNRKGRTLFIGDGISDLVVQPVVDLMVGFGGVVVRKTVAEGAGVFVNSNSLSPILPLALSKTEQEKLLNNGNYNYKTTLEKGLNIIKSGEVVFQNQNFRSKL